ncbi:MAG: hypothetical protein IKO47_06185 [Ruminococcus sp.]|nr:hypothetical protein [Ruminococcus sp.]
MNEMDFSHTKRFDPAMPYKRFVRQMSDWYNGGELPGLAGQDLKFVLKLQKDKMRSLGLDTTCKLTTAGSGNSDTGCFSFSDRIFINSITGGNMVMTRSIVDTDNQLTKNTEDICLTAIIQDLKDGTNPSNDMALCCPHCGAPSTLGELQAGCKHCGTHFLMSEMYPTVMNCFINEKYDRDKNAAKNKHDLKVILTASIIPMIAVGIIGNLFTNQGQNIIMSIILGLLGGIFGGGYIGIMIFVFKKLFEVLGLMGRQMRGGGHTASTLIRANKIKQHDPEFSSEYFRDKVMSLFRMAVYSRDATELACCKCRCPEKAADIIEAQLHNFNINSCKIKDMVCDAEVTLFLDCLHYKEGKVVSKTDKFRMHMRKRIKSPTELGFSFAAVSCPSCGASFDARNVKACPYCNNAYLHEDHDWIMTDLKCIG